MTSEALTFESLAGAIERTHAAFAARAGRAVNASLTLRNWLIGGYIREYEQAGQDRAAYGERLLDQLAERLARGGLKRVEPRELRRFRQFYTAYPEIRQTLSATSQGELGGAMPALGATLAVSTGIWGSVTPESAMAATLAPPPQLLIGALSFTHFVELLQLSDPVERRFYEAEALRGNWSVRELKRQIATQYYARSGLSTDRAALARHAHAGAERSGRTRWPSGK